jgi:tetratricopeptide (TPR) repeat protein
LALFRRKKETADRGQVDSRSKRGGVRRQTQKVKIDLGDLDRRAATAAGSAPTIGGRATGRSTGPAIARRGPATQRMPAPTRPHAAVTRRTTRISGRGTPIGSLLIQAGAVSQDQVNHALRIQQKQGGLIGQILVAMGACRSEDVAAALGKQFRFTQVDLATFKPKIDALLLLMPEKCEELKAIPFERLDQFICVAMVNVLNRKAIAQIETLTRLKVKGFTCAWPQIQQAIKKYYVGTVAEGAKKVSDVRGTGVRIDEFAEQVAGDIRQAVTSQKAPAAAGGAKDAVQAAKAAAMAASAAAAPEVEAEKYIRGALALRAQGKLEEALRRLNVGAAAVPGVAKLTTLLNQIRGEIDAKAEEDRERLARVAGLLAKGRAARAAEDFKAAVRSFQEAAGLDPENQVLAHELASAQKELGRRQAEDVMRKKAEGKADLLAEDEIRRRAAAAAEVQAERRRMGAAASGGEKRLEAGTVTEDSLVGISLTPGSWHARIAAALATRGGEAASTEEALKQLPVAQRYARSREELRSMAAAAMAAEAALEEMEEIAVDGVSEPAEFESEIEAILEAIPEDELGDEDLAEIAEVIAIPETRAEARAISEDEFAQIEPELGPDPVLDWLVTCAGFGRATAVPVED